MKRVLVLSLPSLSFLSKTIMNRRTWCHLCCWATLTLFFIEKDVSLTQKAGRDREKKVKTPWNLGEISSSFKSIEWVRISNNNRPSVKLDSFCRQLYRRLTQDRMRRKFQGNPCTWKGTEVEILGRRLSSQMRSFWVLLLVSELHFCLFLLLLSSLCPRTVVATKLPNLWLLHFHGRRERERERERERSSFLKDLCSFLLL
jgi:hypothetical protein